MPIRSVATFSLEVERNFLHHKSSRLNYVIEKLGQYHEQPSDLDRLLRLRKAVLAWQEQDPYEFAARGGAGLRDEVLLEARRLVPAKSPEQGSLPLVDGDILFRYYPRGMGEKVKGAKSDRGFVQALISTAQGVQNLVHQVPTTEIDIDSTGFSVTTTVRAGVGVGGSTASVQHVGIYVNEMVIEIGTCGLERHAVDARLHYDLVVRSQDHGKDIALHASNARTGPGYCEASTFVLNRFNYPIWDLLNLSLIAHRGTIPLASGTKPFSEPAAVTAPGDRYVIQQRVVCSHFVNAVLYMAFQADASIAMATTHDYDGVFKVSPSQMWKEFIKKQGIWTMTDAEFVGLQHKGRILPNIDPHALNVGLA